MMVSAVYVNRKYGSNCPLEKRAEILTSLKPHVSIEAARDAFTEAEAIEDEAHRTVTSGTNWKRTPASAFVCFLALCRNPV